jgi:hypothetical protein
VLAAAATGRLPLPRNATPAQSGTGDTRGVLEGGRPTVKGNPIVLLALLALLFLGTWGWGWAALCALRRAGWKTADEILGPPLQILVGMALFLSVGGFLVALDIAKFGVLLGWHVIGVGFLAPRVPALVGRAAAAGSRSWLRAGAMAVVGSVLVFLALGQAMGIQLYNPYDDDAAYVYLAKRLLSTGGLADPFNLRRLTSYGGSALYQSMFLQATGNASLRGFELMFALGVVLVVAVGTAKRRWLITGTLLLGVGLIVGDGIGPIVNLSPEFSVAALSLGVFVLLRWVPLQNEQDQTFLYVVIGLLLAAILALRFYFLISVVLAVVVVMVTLRGRRCLRGLLIMAASSVVASIGWAAALQRSSGTPLFPLFGGNYNKSWPSGNDPTLHGVSDFVRRYVNAFNGYRIGWVSLVAVVIALIYLGLTRREPARMIVLLGAALGCFFQMAVISRAFSGSAPVDVIRFIAPSTLACGLLAIDTLWPERKTRQERQTARAAVAASAPTSFPGLRRPLVTVPVRVVLALAVALVIFGASFRSYRHGVAQSVHLGAKILNGSMVIGDRYAFFEKEFRTVNSLVPRGAKVLAAVDRPALLDYSNYTFATLDSPGAVSPGSHMPYFEGAAAKVKYLRDLGYSYIVADSPAEIGLYHFRFLLHQLHQPVYFSREQASYNIDWQSTVTSLENSGRYHVQHAGELSLIRIG